MSKNQVITIKTIHIKSSDISNRLKSIYDHAEDILFIEIINNSNFGVLLTTVKRSKDLRNTNIIFCELQSSIKYFIPEYYTIKNGQLRLRYFCKDYDKDNRSGSVNIILCKKRL